jgi:hypothetical protein
MQRGLASLRAAGAVAAETRILWCCYRLEPAGDVTADHLFQAVSALPAAAAA